MLSTAANLINKLACEHGPKRRRAVDADNKH